MSLLSWGSSYYKQLGNPEITGVVHIPVAVELPGAVVSVVAGWNMSVVLTDEGEVYQWGSDGVVLRADPELVLFPAAVSRVACGRRHALALTDRGRVYAWGCGLMGALGVGSDESFERPVAVAGLADAVVRRVAAGNGTSAAVCSDGRLFMWGINRWAQCAQPADRPFLTSPQLVAVESFAGPVAEVELARQHSSALTEDGVLYTWGNPAKGRLGHPRGPTGGKPQSTPRVVEFFLSKPVAAMACGDYHMLALTRGTRNVYAWGMGDDGQLGFRLRGGMQIQWTPHRVHALVGAGVSQVACGAAYSAAVTDTGLLFTWGYGDGGWLGHGLPDGAEATFDSRCTLPFPEVVEELAEAHQVLAVACGGGHMLAACSLQPLGAPEAPGSSESEDDRLFSAVRHDRFEEVQAALEDGVSPDLRDRGSNTLLLVAAQNGNKRMARLLLRAGADVNAANERGNTALHFAFMYSFASLAKYLVSHGADMLASNDEGRRCVDLST